MTNRERAIRVHEDIINCAPGCTEDIIERALTAAVSDVQARLDAEVKAHAETRAALEVYETAFGVATRAGFAMHDDYGANHDEDCVGADDDECSCGFMDAIHAFCDDYAQKVKALAASGARKDRR